MNSKNSQAERSVHRPEPWTLASLRICSPSVSAEEISQRLHAQPSQAHKLGDPVYRRRPLGLRFSQHVWILDGSVASTEPVKKHLDELVLFVENRSQEVMQLAPSCELDIVCAYSPLGEQGSFAVPEALLKRLAVFPISLVIDVYASPASSPAEQRET
jgi:hypothetical protein